MTHQRLRAGYRRFLPVPLCAAAMGLLFLLPPSSFARSYERWVQPRQLTPIERRVLGVLKRWAGEQGATLGHDARLSRVARRAVRQLGNQDTDQLDLEELRSWAYGWGWTDGQLTTVSLRVSSSADLQATLGNELNRQLGGVELNRVGVACARLENRLRVVLLLSRQLVRLHPVPARSRPRSTLTIAGKLGGRAAGDHNSATLTLVLGLPQGGVRKLPVTERRGRFRKKVVLGSRTGSVSVQLLIDRGHGPEIAAMFPVGVGRNPRRLPLHGEALLIPPGEEPEDPEVTLRSLILGARHAEGLPLLAESAILAKAARAHARDMADHDFFAHVSERTGDVAARLKARDLAFTRALENIARSSGPAEAFRQWMESPAHRSNLLAANVGAFGVGVAHGTAGSGGPIHAVVVLAEPAETGDSAELSTRAVVRINRARTRAGLSKLAADPKLTRVAQRHSRELAGTGEVTAISPVRGHLVDTVFGELDLAEAATDVYRANSLEVVEGSANLRDQFALVGVGVHRNSSTKEGQLFVTVIYASP